MRSIRAALACLLLLAPGAAVGGEWGIGFESHRDWWVSLSGGGMLLDLDGDFRLDEDAGDTKVSLDGALDLSDVITWWATADVQPFRGHHLRFSYLPFDFDGGDELMADLVIDGETFDAGDEVDSHLRLSTYEISYRYDFYLGERVSLSPVVQLSLADALVDVDDETSGESIRERALLPLPYLGLRVEAYPLSRIGLFVEGKGFTIGKKGSVWDAQGGISLHLTENIALLGSYRALGYAISYRDADLDARILTPLFGANVRF